MGYPASSLDVTWDEIVNGRNAGYPETSETALKTVRGGYGRVLVWLRVRKGQGPKVELSSESKKALFCWYGLWPSLSELIGERNKLARTGGLDSISPELYPQQGDRDKWTVHVSIFPVLLQMRYTASSTVQMSGTDANAGGYKRLMIIGQSQI